MSTQAKKPLNQLNINKQPISLIKAKIFQQKKAPQIRDIQFHGSRHRG